MFRYAGSKARVVSQIVAQIPDIRAKRYCEPFLGTGAVAFELLKRVHPPCEFVLSDASVHIMQMWEQLKHAPILLAHRLEQLYIQFPAGEDNYYKVRERHAIDPRAESFLYLAQNSYNGIWRVNRKGQMNTPWGKSASPKPLTLELLTRTAEALHSVVLLRAPFERTVVFWENAVVYADPPYLDSFQYTPRRWTVVDLTRLRDELEQTECQALVSHSDCEEVRELFAKWEIIEIQAYRSISSRANGRGTIKELLMRKR